GVLPGGTRPLAARRLSSAATPLPVRLEPFQLFQDLVEAEAGDELHDVVGQPLVLAHAEDRYDVRVVQPTRRLRLALEPPLGAGVRQNWSRQDLEGDVASQGELLGLVDDAHAAVADLANDPEVPQPLQRRQRA